MSIGLGGDLPRPSQDQIETSIPENPLIQLGENNLDFRQLFNQRDQNTGEYTQRYMIKGIGGRPVEASFTIGQRLIDVNLPSTGGAIRLKAQVNDQEELSFTMATHGTDGQYYQDFPRGRQFFLAAYKFLSEQNTIHAFRTSWSDNNLIRDNYDAFEGARAELLKAFPQHTTLCRQISLEENELRNMKRYDENDFVFDDVTLNELANQDWNDLDERVKSIFKSQDRFTYYKFIRPQIVEIEKKVNVAAAEKTWSGKMAKAIGFPQAHLVKRGPMIFDSHGREYERQIVSFIFTQEDTQGEYT